MDRPEITRPFPAAASEPDAVVAAARADIEAAIARGRLQGDPLRHPLMALSSHLAALLELEHAAAGRQPLPAAFTDEQVRQITFRMINCQETRVKQLVVAANLRSAAIGLAALAGTLAVGMFAEWYLTPAPPKLTCGAFLTETNQPICFRTDGPIPPQPPTPAPQAVAPIQPTPAQPHPTGKR